MSTKIFIQTEKEDTENEQQTGTTEKKLSPLKVCDKSGQVNEMTVSISEWSLCLSGCNEQPAHNPYVVSCLASLLGALDALGPGKNQWGSGQLNQTSGVGQ